VCRVGGDPIVSTAEEGGDELVNLLSKKNNRNRNDNSNNNTEQTRCFILNDDETVNTKSKVSRNIMALPMTVKTIFDISFSLSISQCQCV
jgi:hypothetical protein